MRKVNAAYSAGDQKWLETLLTEWESSPENVQGEDAASELVRTIRKIHQIQKRIETIEGEQDEILTSDEYQLLEKENEADAQGHNYIADLAKELDKEIFDLAKELASRRKEGSRK